MITSEAFLAFVGTSAMIVVLLAGLTAGWEWTKRTPVRSVLLTLWVIGVVLWLAAVGYGLYWAKTLEPWQVQP